MVENNNKANRIFLWLITLTLFFGSASALSTHLNITIVETVHQNVTFAENFDLVENRTYSLIEGVVTVRNPGSETVYDTYLKFVNVESMSSDFVYSSGKNMSQKVFPQIGDNITNYSTGNINSSGWFDLQRDLDEDGLNDSVTVNQTHIIFNITSEYQLLAQNFYNSTNNSLNLSAGDVLDMYFNLTSLRDDNEYNTGVVFAVVNLTGTVATPGQLVLGSEVQLIINDTQRNYSIVHIPELRSGQQSVFVYNVSSLLVDPPLDIDTTYTDPEFATKVLAGEKFNLTLIAKNIATVGDLIDVNITLQAADINVSNGTQYKIFNFTLHDLQTIGDWGNVTNTSNRTWYWVVNNGTIGIGESYNISFSIRAPDTVGSSGTFLALTQTLAYKIATTASTLKVDDVRARSAITFNTTKQIVSPQDNQSNNNVTWVSEPFVGTTENITYTLEKVTLWVTTTLDPNAVEPGLSKDYNVNTDINLTNSWAGAGWYFNFTDGSSDANPPPIVWIKPYWIIKNIDNQIVNSSITVNGTDLYMNYIYVVNGYWLDIEKKVLDVGDGRYDIRITVRNRGNGYTPQNMTVTAYDFVPSEFVAWNFSPSYNNLSNVTGEFSGIAYRWDAGLRTNISTSFAPKGDPNGLDYWYINYSVNGSGEFKVSELYIVGLDPRLVDGASAFEGVSVISSIASTSREVIYLAVVVFLIAINLANFLMTRKISQKLDKK